MRHVLSALVQNVPGVLAHISGMLASRGFNIDSLVVSRGHQPGFSRMTIACEGERKILGQIVKQLDKLIDTVHAAEYVASQAVERELALFKVTVNAENRTEVFQVIEVFKGRTVDISERTVTVELTGDSEKLDAFENQVQSYGLVEMIRSGKLVIARGSERTT